MLLKELSRRRDCGCKDLRFTAHFYIPSRYSHFPTVIPSRCEHISSVSLQEGFTLPRAATGFSTNASLRHTLFCHTEALRPSVSPLQGNKNLSFPGYPKKKFLFFILESKKILYYCSSTLRIVGEPGILHGEGCGFVSLKSH